MPFHPGLIFALFTLLAAFLRELWSAASNAMSYSEHQAIAKVLSMVDLTLMAGLVVIVIFSATRTSSRASTRAARGTGRPG